VVGANHGDHLYIWDAVTSQVRPSPFRQQTSRINAFAFSADGHVLAMATWSKRHTITLWDLRSNRTIQHLDCSSEVLTLAVSHDGRSVAAGLRGRGGGPVDVWDAVTGKNLHRFGDHKTIVQLLAFSPEGRTVLGAGGGTAQIWDVSSGDLVRQFRDTGNAA